MKKFIISVFILLIAGGTAFYFGWIQFSLDAGEYAVVFTKTRGFEEKPIKAGEFQWRWEALLPTNLSLYTFKLTPHAISLKASGSLPSEKLYEGVTDLNPDFTYSINLSASVVVNSEKLPKLVESGRLSQDNLDNFYKNISERMTAYAANFFHNKLASMTKPENDFLYKKVLDSLEEDLEKKFSAIKIESITPKQIHIPDMEVYRKAKSIYFDILEKEKEMRLAEINTRNTQSEAISGEIQRLSEYGEILDRYPVLLKYFALKSSGNLKTSAGIPELENILGDQ